MVSCILNLGTVGAVVNLGSEYIQMCEITGSSAIKGIF